MMKKQLFDEYHTALSGALCSPCTLTHDIPLKDQSKVGGSKANSKNEKLLDKDCKSKGDQTTTKRINKSVFYSIFKKLIRSFEEHPELEISIMDVSKQYGVQHRRIYDFFNLLTYFGVCKNQGHGRISWSGIQHLYSFIEQLYLKLEKKANYKSFTQIFHCGQSPSLGTIAKLSLSLYMYLGTDVLNVKFIAKILSQGKGEIKTFERRTYLVLNMLEIIGVIAHSKKISEYRFAIHFKVFDSFVFNEKLKDIENNNSFFPLNLLNRFGENVIEKLREDRNVLLTNYLHQINERCKE